MFHGGWRAIGIKRVAPKGNPDGKHLYAASDSPADAFLAEALEAAEHGSIFALTYPGEDYYFERNDRGKDIQKTYAY